MKHVLVTGGAGYIGSHIAKALSQSGYIPVTVDNLSSGHRSAVKWGPFIEGNCGDQTLISNVCKDFSIFGVIHLAAFSNVRESEIAPLNYFHNNVAETINLLEALINHQVSYFVFSSTCAIYGMPKTIPIDEAHPKNPINTYGLSKLMVENILDSVSNSHDMHVSHLRYFNAAGADIDGEIGESHKIETHLIPNLIQAAMGRKKSFTLNGEDHATEDGTPIRDFIHVSDLASAHVKALEWMAKNKQNLSLNLGTGKGHSIHEIISALEESYDLKIPVNKSKRFLGDPPILVADSTKAKNALNWSPKYSDLRTILKTAWDWEEKKAKALV